MCPIGLKNPTKKFSKSQRELRTWLCAAYECAKGTSGLLNLTLLNGLAHFYAAMDKSPFSAPGLSRPANKGLKALKKLVSRPYAQPEGELIITKVNERNIIVQRGSFQINPEERAVHIHIINELLSCLKLENDIEHWVAGTAIVVINSGAQPKQIRDLVQHVANYDLSPDQGRLAMKVFPSVINRVAKLYETFSEQVSDQYLEQLRNYLDSNPFRIIRTAHHSEMTPVFGLGGDE